MQQQINLSGSSSLKGEEEMLLASSLTTRSRFVNDGDQQFGT